MDGSATFPHPFQPLANPPTCIAALYTKEQGRHSIKMFPTVMHKHDHHCSPYSDDTRCLDTYYTGYNSNEHNNSDMSREMHGNDCQIWQPIHILKLPTACSATSSHFYLPPRYETPILNVNVSLNMTNLQMINISALHVFTYGKT